MDTNGDILYIGMMQFGDTKSEDKHDIYIYTFICHRYLPLNVRVLDCSDWVLGPSLVL